MKALAGPTLRHRIQLRPEVELDGATPDGVLPAFSPRCPCRDDADRQGGAAGTLGALAVLVFRTGGTVLIIDLAIVLAIIADAGFAARTGSCR